MAKISALADEILYLIFLHTLPSDIVGFVHWIERTSISPLNLSFVCRSWYRIVASRSTLWSSVRIKYCDGRSSRDLERRTVPMFFYRWLQRTIPAQTLLDISLDIEIENAVHGGKNSLIQFLDTLSDHLHRLRSIEITLRDWCLVPRRIRPVILKISSATTSVVLEHEIMRSRRRLIPQVLLDLSSSAVDHTRLRCLSVTSGMLWRSERSAETPILDFPVLDELIIRVDPNYDLAYVYDLLAACPNIETLFIQDISRVDFYPFNFTLTLGSHILSFIRLRSLHLNFDLPDILSHILGWLTSPSLTSLHVFIGNFSHSVLDALTELFERSRGGYPDLSSSSSSENPPAIITPRDDSLARALEGMLRVLGDLTELDLEGGLVVDTRVIEAMTTSAAGAICPRLAKLRLVCVDSVGTETPRAERGTSGVPLEVVENMIESRCKPSRTLEAVELRIPGYSSAEEKSGRVQTLINEGLVFH